MRRYLKSHPWITFKATDFNDLEPRTWMLLGEAHSKCEHLAGQLAAAYATKGPRTLSRDVNRLRDAGLVHKHYKGWMANQFIMKAFLPPVAEGNH